MSAKIWTLPQKVTFYLIFGAEIQLYKIELALLTMV